MAQPYVHAGAALIEVPVTLSGPNMLTVTANVSVSHRNLSQGQSDVAICFQLPSPASARFFASAAHVNMLLAMSELALPRCAPKWCACMQMELCRQDCPLQSSLQQLRAVPCSGCQARMGL